MSRPSKIGTKVQALLPSVRGTGEVFAERTQAGYFLNVNWKREELARYGDAR